MTPPRRRLPIAALIVANVLSFLSEGLSMVAIPWFVLQLTGSYAQMGIVGFFTVLPRVIATFLGGQVVDRIGYRTASALADTLSGVSVLAIPLLYAMDRLTFPVLLAFVVIGAVFDGPGATAKEVMTPELTQLAGASLERVNSLVQGARRLSLFLGPVIAGGLTVWVGVENVLWVNALVFALAAAIVLTCIPSVQAVEDADERGSFRSNMLYGARFLRQNRLVLWLAISVGVMNFLDGPLVTVHFPALVNEHYGGAGTLGIFLGAEGLGMVIGSLLFTGIAGRFRRRSMFITCFALVGVEFLVLAFAPPFPILLATVLLGGIAAGPLNPILMTVRQEQVPLASRARVFGTTTAIAFVAMPFGQVIGGFTVEWIGVRAAIGLIAACYFAAVVVMAMNPVLRGMDPARVSNIGVTDA
jgi:MFS family permease